jgi:23S rRNA (cytosine1962-C5)-methyltransferase
LRVTAAAEREIRRGHPWVFAERVRDQNREGQVGEVAVIYDSKDRFLAAGLFDPFSPIRVRVLHTGKPQPIDGEWWREQLAKALKRRAGLFDDQTNGYRWINGESDGWPGLVLDRYAQTLVVKLYTAAWLPRLNELSSLFLEALCPDTIVLRLSRNIEKAAAEQFLRTDGEVLCGRPLSRPVVFLESGLRFEADILRGQKTGFFIDQRENRRKVEALARGRTVLNSFSFSGAFSVYAARGGASAVTDLDLSRHALESAGRNFSLNKSISSVAACRREFVQADAFKWLEQRPARKFDLVVADPPAFAKRQSERAAAIRAYSRLAGLSLQHLSPGGILVVCSCSAHVTAEEFFGAIRKSVVQSGRGFSVLDTMGHAPDHPAVIKEQQYLKAIYLQVG